MAFANINHDKFITGAIATCLVVLIPYLHLGLVLGSWTTDSRPVDKHSCTCSCWDHLFKGRYEFGVAGYKNVYFNITVNTFKIWALSACAVVVTYECARHLLQLYLTSHLRYSMVLLVTSAIYPHYYSWWMYFNYWNDGYYDQWNHQTFFSLTELTSTLAVVHLCDTRSETSPRWLLAISSIALLHILASSADQFVENVLYQRGHVYQITRDLGFMAPDVLHLILPIIVLKQYATKHHMSPCEALTGRDLLWAAVSVLGLLAVCRQL